MVANDLPFLRDLIVGEGFGVVHRLKEPADYAVAISEIFEAGKIERCKLCLKSRRGAYSWSVEERKLLDIYAKLNMGSRSSAVAATLSTGNG
jgi:glycosyltransferase involved in cell wall biosynthesis